jgi:putative hydrolase of the HAD superfamily
MTFDTFRTIKTWVFDLDNTLYPASSALFSQIEARMTRYVSDFLGVDAQTANALRDTYWRDHGTTLAGLMTHHAMPPEDFMADVHDIDFSVLAPDPALAEFIKRLPGRKIIYTNGSAPYARQVLSARGLTHFFEDIYGVEHADWHPKPTKIAFDKVFAKAGFDPKTAVMFEDDSRNLLVPHQLGMATVHVSPTPETAPHLHFQTDDLTAFLSQLHQRAFPTDTAALP